MKAALACLVLLTHSAFCEEPLAQSARARVVEFCETEFKGNHAKRVEYFQISLRDKSAVDFASEPVDLINGYKVLSVEIKGSTAKVVVDYDLIGELKNVRYSGYPGLKARPGTWIDRADKLVVKRNQSFHQTISLTLEPVSRKWFISNSQIPKVARKAVLDLLHKEVDEKRETLKRNKGEALPHIEAALNWDLNKIKLLEGMESSPLNLGLIQPSPQQHFPFTAEEDTDGARYVWFICNQAGVGYDYLSAQQFPKSPKFRPLMGQVPLAGDVAWWKNFMALYNPEAPENARLMTARGNFSLNDLEKRYGRVKWFRMTAAEN